jgi:hypothetical protein
MKLILITLLFSLSAFAEKNDFTQKQKSIQAFKRAATVFMHPRCLNCHPAGDRPTQGMDMHVHTMNVQRGDADNGKTGMQCSTCHQAENNESSKVPGAPEWKLAPIEQAWVGLTVGQLCRRLKDPNSTHMTFEELNKHNAENELVAWGWKPGSSREPAPGSQKEFARDFAEWVSLGAHCPE